MGCEPWEEGECMYDGVLIHNSAFLKHNSSFFDTKLLVLDTKFLVFYLSRSVSPGVYAATRPA